MQFSLGDKVLFKKDDLEGEVVRINSPYKVTVLSMDGFEMNISIKDLVKIEKETNKVSSYGKGFYSKDSNCKEIISHKKKRIQSVVQVDLHIELLTSNHVCMDNHEIVQIQLKECYNKIEKALSSNVTKLEIIHGIGGGILKNKVHDILREYNLRFYLKEDGGATEVYF